MRRYTPLFLSFLALLFALLFSTALFAFSDVINTRTLNTTAQNTNDTMSIESQAAAWGLTATEWKRYSTLMQGRIAQDYAKLTPPEVLGLYATTPQELAHFAELAAKQEHDKIERELRFNAAFYLAAKRLYADEPLIRSFDLTPYTPLHTQS